MNGLAWVKDGIIGVKPPAPGGSPAVVVPCPQVELIATGRKTAKETQVVDSSHIKANLPQTAPSVAYTLKISPDGIVAHLSVIAKAGVRLRLVDKKPSDRLILEVSDEPVPPKSSLEEVLEFLASQGVRVGIDEKACRFAAETLPAEPVPVARGIPPTPGTDAHLQMLVRLQKTVELPQDTLRVDFREIVQMPDVKEGKPIAVKTDAVPGTPGTSVTGSPVLPPKPKDIRIRPGKGTQVVPKEGGEIVLAAVSGCPMYNERSGVITVEPLLIHPGDVDLSSGNIRSSGSVRVLGQVAEGMKVDSEGEQQISGAVTEATLKAWGGITLAGNAFKSTIEAGKDVSWMTKSCELLEEAEEIAEGILQLEGHLRAFLAETGRAGKEQALLLVEETYHTHFRKLAETVSTIYKQDLARFPDEVAGQIMSAVEALEDARPCVFERAGVIRNALGLAITWIREESQKGQSDIILPYAQGCKIKASRDIFVTGPGAFYSIMSAGRSIKVEGSPGLVRGGTAKARELVSAKQLGGPGYVPTIVEVSAQGQILAGTVFPGTVLSVDRRRMKTEDTLSTVKARLVGDKMVINSASGPIRV